MSLTVSRTPLRITLGGGGSDLGADGLCVAAAINVYTYVVVNRNRGSEYILKYSDKVERVSNLEDIEHPLIHACLVAVNCEPGVEIAWLADIDSGMGLGSSASFVVGTLRALGLEQEDAADVACEIDTGWQDQWICATGGVKIITRYMATDLDCNYVGLGRTLRLFNTGMKHDAPRVLLENKRPEQHVLIRQARDAIGAIESSNWDKLAKCFNEQWATKLNAAPTIEHETVNNALMPTLQMPGKKLVGAGNGGYILTCGPGGMTSQFLSDNELPFTINMQGSVIL